MTLHVIVEGATDEPIARKITHAAKWMPESVSIQIMCGKGAIDANLPRYNQAANWTPMFVLSDLDRDEPCAGNLRAKLLPNHAPFMCFRVAVHSIESWLLADPETLAAFLHISPTRVPLQPDTLPVPKEWVVNLARLSSKPGIRKDIVPEPGKSRSTGAGYAGCLNQYSQNHWRPEVARHNSPSLNRAIAALERMRSLWTDGAR